MGGTNHPSNLVELTVEEHAEAHRKLYEEHGLLQDKLAWLGLLGLISGAEIIHALQSEGMKGPKNPMWGKPAPNRGVKRPGVGGRKKGTLWTDQERECRMLQRNTDEYRNKMKRVYQDPERNKKIGQQRLGKIGAAQGKKWYNNGLDESYFVEDQQPSGWMRGRINKK